MKILTANEQMISSWVQLAQEMEEHFPGFDPQEFRASVTSAVADGRAFAAVEGEAVKGGIFLDSHGSEILWFGVSPTTQGQGLGRALLQKALDEGTRPMTVITYRRGDPLGKVSYPLYLKMGFQKAEEIDAFGYACDRLVCK